jgi:tetratricopeptide (TPR) repeat protein
MSDLRAQLQSRLGASYTLQGELGGAGMSRVFVATETSLGRRIVVKILPPEMVQGVSVERFQREIQLAAQLQHPHIVPLLSAGDVDGLPYFTMPFVEGESLRARLARGELPSNEVIGILRDVARALEAAHGKGVIHRDIKPDNVLLCGGSAMVSDFGVAKAISSATAGNDAPATLTALGIALGTPLYMAPEQAAADPSTDHRADIYALGTMAYEMLAGRAPFAGRPTQQLAAAHATETPVNIAQIRPSVPAPLALLVMRCLEKHPADRPQSAREIVQSLETIVTPSGLVAGVASATLTRRRVAIVAGIAATVAAVVAGGVYRMLEPNPIDAKRVLVAPWENMTGDASLAIVPRMTADWIASGIGQLDSIRVVPMSTVVDAIRDTAITSKDARNLAQRLKAGIAISGSFYRKGDSLRFEAQVIDVRSGNVTRSVDNVMGPASDPMVAIGLLRERVMGTMALADNNATIGFGATPRMAAYESLLHGQDFFNKMQYDKAIPFLEKAIELDSTFMAPYAVLGAAHLNAGRPRVSDSLVRLVSSKRQYLTHTDRVALNYALAGSEGDRDAAYRVAKAEADRDPQLWLWPYLAGLEAVARNRATAAVAAFESVPDPEKRWQPFWGNYTIALHQIGDYRKEERVASRADRLFPGAMLQAHVRSAAGLGDLTRLRQLIDSVTRTSTDTVSPPADMMNIAALELRAHGHPDEARKMFEMQRAWYASRPEAEAQTRRRRRYAIANNLVELGRYDSARSGLAEYVQVDSTDATALARLARADIQLGDTAAALHISQRIAGFPTKFSRGQWAYSRARIAADLGDRESAVRLIKEALAQGMSFGAAVHREPEFISLRGYAPFDALLRPKP